MGKVFAITQKGCEACKQLKDELPDLETVDVEDNEEAERLADELGVDYVPAIVEVKDNGDVCLLDENGQVTKCLRGVKGLKNLLGM